MLGELVSEVEEERVCVCVCVVRWHVEHRGSRVDELVLESSRKGVLESDEAIQDTHLDPVLLLMLYHLDCLWLLAKASRVKPIWDTTKTLGTMAYTRDIGTLPMYTQSFSIIRLR